MNRNELVFERKIYKKLVERKEKRNGKTALLIEGARRVGKTTIAKEFAKNEYKSYLCIDFSNTKTSFSKDVKKAFEESKDLDELFLMLQLATGTKLYKRESIIIFDEVQKYVKARELIKLLVADGRYDYIEAGSLITLRKNSKNILIPSEESKLEMYPMDFEEFLLALKEDLLLDYIKKCLKEKKPLMESIHKKTMNLYRIYMAVGGMPQAVSEYILTKDFEKVDLIKGEIIELYREDLNKISRKSSSVTPLIIYDKIQSIFSNHSFEMDVSSFSKNMKLYTFLNNLDDLKSSKVVNIAENIQNIDASLTLGYDIKSVKIYVNDTGLLIKKMFIDKPFLDNSFYNALIFDKISLDQGFLFENAVAQQLIANGYKLKYSSFYNKESKNKYEIDFFIETGKKISPIEVKSAKYNTHKSLDIFCEKYHQYIDKKYIIYNKNYKKEDNIIYLPIYMVMCL